jgi:penicillin-binding protein 2
LIDNYHSWYVAYAPYRTDVEEERVVVVVSVEADADGYEWWSPKACNVILQGIFANQTYEEAVDSLNLWYLRQEEDQP